MNEKPKDIRDTHQLKSLATAVMMYRAASETSHDVHVPSVFNVVYIYIQQKLVVQHVF